MQPMLVWLPILNNKSVCVKSCVQVWLLEGDKVRGERNGAAGWRRRWWQLDIGVRQRERRTAAGGDARPHVIILRCSERVLGAARQRRHAMIHRLGSVGQVQEIRTPGRI